MENTTKFLGINKKSIIFFHRIMLIAMLHSSFVAPCQLWAQGIYDMESISYNYSQNNYLRNINFEQKLPENEVKIDPTNIQSEPTVPQNLIVSRLISTTVMSFEIMPDIQEGIIGVSTTDPLDDASDNLFKFNIHNIPNKNFKAYLNYELFGVQDNNAVARSFNDRPSTGGYIVKNNNSWTNQNEEINIEWLNIGENKLMFSIPNGSLNQYKVRNVKLIFKENKNNLSPALIVNNSEIPYTKDNHLYIKGFLKDYKKTSVVYAGDTKLQMVDGEYEGLVILSENNKTKNFLSIKAYDESGLVGQEIISLTKKIEADHIFPIEQQIKPSINFVKAITSSTITTEDVSIKIPETALLQNKEISISRLRKIDIAPLPAGLINVTKGGYAFRFLPDGTKFEDLISLKIPYDEKLVPKGHNINEIKTFYFNTETKAWTSVERDSINKSSKTVISSTNHFTDYINGIIQTPESPETSSFTSNMMNDIKAADPSAEMTIISPPEVSQKGSAGISYPIKIPAGRKGMQPNIALQYNSEAGNGWLGQGWDLSIQAITIDTKWGVPIFNSESESEIYNLNGEQLMYPKQSGKDWMPNRHYDVAGAVDGIFSTQVITRTANLQFTPRKQGSFAKIQRLGNATTNYYWKVTNSDGSINWYGGKTSVNPNAIMRDSKNNIVQWALFMTEDIFGNCVKYEYNNSIIESQTGQNVNLNNGLIFSINNIKYTGYNDNDYKYQVIFESSKVVRQDVSINARLGVKQILPYVLDNIIVKKFDDALIRRYQLNYENSIFQKKQLKSVSEYDKDGKLFYSHDFNYYDDVSIKDQKNAIALFDERVEVDFPAPNNPNFTLGINQILNASNLGTTQTFDYGWEITPELGLEIRWRKISQDDYKLLNFGLPFGKSFSKSNGIVTFIDIDGNGLDDLVYRTNDGIRYYPRYFNPETNQTSFGIEKEIKGIQSFNKSSNETQNKLFESWNMKLQLPWGNKFNVGKRRFVSKSNTEIYFTDGNGDGLIDIVKDNQVLFNTGADSNGIIKFVTSSKETPNLLITADAEKFPAIISQDEITEEGAFDVVRVWVAPKSGTIQISDLIALDPDLGHSLDSNSKGIYSIETSHTGINSNTPFRLYFKELTSQNNSSTVSILNYSGNNPPLGLSGNLPLNVVKNQRIYFRLHANPSGMHYKINSSPTIKYVNEANLSILIDENLEDHISSKYETSFILDGGQPYEAPENGLISINWDLITFNNLPNNILSDNVKYEIVKTTSTPNQNEEDVEQIIYSKTISTGLISNLTPQNYDSGQNVSVPFSVNLGNPQNPNSVSISFRVTSDSNLKWKQIQWMPKIIFTPTNSNTTLNESATYPVVEHSIYKSTFSKKLKPISNWITPNSVVDYGLKVNTNVVLPANNGGDFLMVVKKGGLLIGKRLISVTGTGAVTVNNSSPLMFNNPINITQVNQQFDYTVGFYTDNSIDDELIASFIAATNNKPVLLGYNWSQPINSNYYLPISVESCYNNLNRFGPMFREWGQFFYNEELDNTTSVPADNIGKLLNKFFIDKNYNINTSDYSNFDCGDPAAPGYADCMANANINNVNPGQYEDPDSIPDDPNHPMYQEINPVFYAAVPLRGSICGDDRKCNIIEKWTGAFDSQYTSAQSFFSGSFESSSFANVFTDTNQPEQVVQANLNNGMLATSKLVESVSISKSSGWSPFSVTSNESRYSNTSYDFLDVNGDRYPDILSANQIKTTQMTGGHNSIKNHNYGIISSNFNKGKVLTGLGLGNAVGTSEVGSVGKGTSEGNPVAAMLGGPLQVGIDLGTINQENTFWMDLNGDGLPDKIANSGSLLAYHLNIGNINAPVNYENFNSLAANESKPNPLALSFNVPLPIESLFDQGQLPFSINLSIGASMNGTSTKVTFTDVNSDGLVDLVQSNSVKLNYGNGFYGTPIPFYTPSLAVLSLDNDNKTMSATASGSVNRFFSVFSWFKWPKFLRIFHLKAGANVGGNASLTLSKTHKSFKDFNGDGHIDIVEKDGDDIYVYYSRMGRTGLLKSVRNPLGGEFTIDYKPQRVSYDNPHPKWAMTDVIINDNYNKLNDGVDIYKKNYSYENAKYDRREREFYGYKTVKAKDYIADASGVPVLYRTSISNYLNQSYFTNGLLDDAIVIKGSDINKKFSRTKNYYEIYKLNNTNDLIDTTTIQLANYDVGGTEGRRSAIVLLSKTVNELYELAASPQISTQVQFKYDTKGRIVEYINDGDLSTTNDNYTSTISYHNSMSAQNVINIPSTIKVTAGVILRERKTEINPANGTIKSVFVKNNNTWIETKMNYDTYGNMSRIQYPMNTDGVSMFYEYIYDTEFNKYISKISNAFGYNSLATYNSDFDKIVETVDISGNKIKYDYDSFGRNIKIIGPKEQAAGKPYTIKFEYFPYLSQLPGNSGVSNGTFVPVAVTSHYDSQHPTNDIETYTFIDGLARPIQLKKDIWIDKNNNPTTPNFVEALSVSGKVFYDEQGRATKQFHPWWETKTSTTKFLINEHSSSFSNTTFFDELDRPIKTIDAEGNISQTQYSLGTDVTGTTAIKTRSIVDQNNSQQIISETFKNVAGNVISTKDEGGISGAIWTKFNYNQIGELLSYTDAQNLTTSYEYDKLGRKLSVTHPDNGKTSYNYDNVNLVSLQTANLQVSGGLIKYKYDINRVSKILYPNTPTGALNLANVSYSYGNSGNQTGRLISQIDASGSQNFEYGSMGELISNSRTVVGPNIPTRTFNTTFSYDSWNRLLSMQYPDGENVIYNYDLGGNLNNMIGQLNKSAYSYIKRIDYNHYEQRTFLNYGNNTKTYYTYTPAMNRLDVLNVKTFNQSDLLNNKYLYDKVSNIVQVKNSAPFTTNKMAGIYTHNFRYDNLNRLSGADGSFNGDASQILTGNDANSTYNLRMSYNDTHGIVSKDQYHNKNGTTYQPNTYDNDYTYAENTHQVKKIEHFDNDEIENFRYDLNGNIIQRSNRFGSRNFLWDESNRLRVVSENNAMQHYIYDASGERILKANSDVEAVYENGILISPGTVTINGYTSYPSGFLVISPDGLYTKHYYANSQRIISRIGDNDASIFESNSIGFKQGSDDSKFDGKELKNSQKIDLQNYASKLKRGIISFRDYQFLSLAQQEEAILADREEESDSIVAKIPINTPPIYYYHSDHLGTSTSLTDYNGKAYQFFLNLPFGETMAQQLGSNYFNSPYKFNGKELDEETGFYYYGARYYDPKISIWMSVDPLAESFPSASPYNYCLNNPVNLVDPDGQLPIPLITGGIGAAAGLIYGIATGKSWKETLALTGGGFVAGATLGFGTLAISAVGGVSTIGTTGVVYATGASSIIGGMLGNVTEQAIKNNGQIDKNEVLVSGVYGIPDAVLGGVVGKGSKGVENGLSNYFGAKLAEETSASTLKGFKKEIAKDLREQGLGRRQANKAANRAVNKYQAGLEEGFKATQIGIKVTGKTVDVSLSAVQIGALEEIKAQTQK